MEAKILSPLALVVLLKLRKLTGRNDHLYARTSSSGTYGTPSRNRRLPIPTTGSAFDQLEIDFFSAEKKRRLSRRNAIAGEIKFARIRISRTHIYYMPKRGIFVVEVRALPAAFHSLCTSARISVRFILHAGFKTGVHRVSRR